MITKQQQAKIAKRCTEIIIEAIEALPDLLAQTPPAAAAAIVASLIKAQTQPEVETIEDIYRQMCEMG